MTQIDTHERQIDGRTFVVHKLPPLDAQDILIDIIGAVGPAIGHVAAGVKVPSGPNDAKGSSLVDREIDPGALAGGIQSLVGALDKDTMRLMVNTFAKVSMVDGMPLAEQIPILFREDFALMYKWLWFALGVQFGGFFKMLPSVSAGGLLGKLQALVASQQG